MYYSGSSTSFLSPDFFLISALSFLYSLAWSLSSCPTLLRQSSSLSCSGSTRQSRRALRERRERRKKYIYLGKTRHVSPPTGLLKLTSVTDLRRKKSRRLRRILTTRSVTCSKLNLLRSQVLKKVPSGLQARASSPPLTRRASSSWPPWPCA